MTGDVCALGRGARDAIEEEDGAVFMTEQDDDDEHVKLLNPVKVQAWLPLLAGLTLCDEVTIALGCI